ncbi:hypothetical protein LOZ58_006136 [Ophidiomyces ophidiicola]|nr:hypothetical protein LOZ58_006136 [Ophidiomyces ophidiicola]
MESPKPPLTISVTSHYCVLTHRKVEGEAQGDDESVQRLLVDIAQGPPHAQVLKLENSEINPKAGDARFQVVR